MVCFRLLCLTIFVTVDGIIVLLIFVLHCIFFNSWDYYLLGTPQVDPDG